MTDDMVHRMNEGTSPDIRIHIRGEDSIITACEALTQRGAEYLSKHAILGLSYDSIDMDGMWWEWIDEEE